MASRSKQIPPKRLAELLEEQQEPFVLEIYLLERGFKPKSFEIQGQLQSKSLKRSSTRNGANRTSSRTSGRFLNVARNLYNKFVSINQVLGLNYGFLGEKKHETNRCSKRNDKTVAAESYRISFAGSCNSCSANKAMEETMSSPTRNEFCETAPVGVMTLWRFMEENKQCSPVSVLDEIDFLQGFPVYNVRQEKKPSASRLKLSKKTVNDSILSESLSELLSQSCKGNSKNLSVDKANIKQMVRMELILGSTQEWGGWEAYRRLIALEVEDDILGEIKDEIVRDMSDQF